MLLKIAPRGILMLLMVDAPSEQILWFDFEHGHFTTYRISRQQAESLAKCPLTLKIAQTTHSFRLYSVVNSIKYINININICSIQLK